EVKQPAASCPSLAKGKEKGKGNAKATSAGADSGVASATVGGAAVATDVDTPPPVPSFGEEIQSLSAAPKGEAPKDEEQEAPGAAKPLAAAALPLAPKTEGDPTPAEAITLTCAVGSTSDPFLLVLPLRTTAEPSPFRRTYAAASEDHRPRRVAYDKSEFRKAEKMAAVERARVAVTDSAALLERRRHAHEQAV
ncbi:unnamed protein product, partial [Laminaria digitata]